MRILRIIAIVTLWVTATWAQNAYVQLIHNVADVVGVSTPVVLDSIDIYLSTDGGATWTLPPATSNFKFRQATPYVQLPANSTSILAGIAPGNSTGPAQIITTYPIPALAPNSYNIAVIAGTIDFVSLQVNVDIYYYNAARAVAQNSSQFEFLLFHGSPDVGTVGAYLAYDRPATASAYQPDLTLAQYAYFPSYLGLSSENFVVLDTSIANPNDILPVGFYVPDPALLGLIGQTGVVFASGYANTLDPNKAFGLFVALSSGNVLPLPADEVRRLQIVHNAADPALAQVDVYAGSITPANLLARLDFRQATSTMFANAPTGASISLLFTPRNQPSQTLATVPLAIPPAGSNYILFAQGVSNPASFASNPNGIPTTFGLTGASVEGWAPSGSFKFRPFHGVTDAPAVDLYAGSTPLATNLQYKDFGGMVTLPAGTAAQVEVRPAGQSTPVATFPLSSAQSRSGEGTVIFASGFLNPSANQNGPAFGLYIVYPNGEVQPLSTSTGIALPAQALFIQVEENPTLNGSWRVCIGAADRGQLDYVLSTVTGQVLEKGSWFVPGQGTWFYVIEGSQLPSGVYLLQVGGKTLRLVRY
ncbi:MAG: DUF4397 domain-containing protein [Bacteroidia bacterium]|nr:DUF4397 domain-containing protein [Bacteroidia bacterium]